MVNFSRRDLSKSFIFFNILHFLVCLRFKFKFFSPKHSNKLDFKPKTHKLKITTRNIFPNDKTRWLDSCILLRSLKFETIFSQNWITFMGGGPIHFYSQRYMGCCSTGWPTGWFSSYLPSLVFGALWPTSSWTNYDCCVGSMPVNSRLCCTGRLSTNPYNTHTSSSRLELEMYNQAY